jgi:anti-anti-sigma factor
MDGGTVTVVLRGEFDLASADFLADRLERISESRPRRLVYDVAQVAFMDCASARLIADTGRSLPAGVKPVVKNPPPIMLRLLEVTGIDTLVQLELRG